MKSISNEKNLESKKILLRLDLNVPLEDGKISDTTRIDKILPTLNFLIHHKTKIIILSHVGRPKGKRVKENFEYSSGTNNHFLSIQEIKDLA